MTEFHACPVPTLRPAFTSDGVLLGFVLLLLLLVLMPLYAGWSGEESYLESIGDEPQFAFLHQETFINKEPLDILISGGSNIWNGISPVLLEETFSKRYQRPFRVITAGLNGGKDQFYLLVKNILQRRKVRLLVQSDYIVPMTSPHENAFRRWIHREHLPLWGRLPWQLRLAFYTESVLGSPRHLLSLARPNVPRKPHESTMFHQQHGALMIKQNYKNRTPFTPFLPTLPDLTPEEMFYSEHTRERFVFLSRQPDDAQLVFQKDLARLLQESGTQSVYINTPYYSPEDMGEKVNSPVNPQRVYNPQAHYMGIPRTLLFSGLDNAAQERLFVNGFHLNENGAQAFTKIIIPALARLLDPLEFSEKGRVRE